MVIAIHTHPFSEINEGLCFLFTQVIPRIAVPFFFAVAGYFFIQKLEKKQKAFFTYIKRILFTYSLWSIFYFIIDLISSNYSTLSEFIINCTYKFIVSGSHFHFWFFPALIFSVCFTTLLFRLNFKKILFPLSIVLYIIGCIGCSYYEIGINMPIIGNLFSSPYFTIIRRILLMGFPFFISGYLVYKIKDKIFNSTTNQKLLFLLLITVSVWLFEIFIVIIFKWQRNIVITLNLYLLVIITLLILLKNPLQKFQNISNICKTLSNFVYYCHPFFIICFKFIDNRFLHINITETPMFFIISIIASLAGIIIYKLNNKVLNYFVT